MGLTKYKLGELIELCETRNDNLKYGVKDVKGISIQKEFIETKANMEGVSLKPYYLVQPDDFVYVTVTSRNGEKITLAHNISDSTYIVSSSYVVFKVKRIELLLSDYLFMYFNRPEFDRFSRFNSWGSARETFNWEDMCDIDIELPNIEIQQKHVDVYNAMLENQKSYESGLDDLKLVCDAYIEERRKELPHKKLKNYISLCDEKNDDLEYGLDAVRGISIEKRFIYTKANMEGVYLKPYAVVKPDEFAYVTVTSRNGEKISLARNNSDEAYICSSSYIVFEVDDTNTLLPAYLSMLFERSEFNRYKVYGWMVNGVQFTTQDGLPRMIPLIDFDNWDKNIFRVVNQFTVEYTNNGQKENRRPDVLLFVNGMPLCVIELKNPADANATIYDALF